MIPEPGSRAGRTPDAEREIPRLRAQLAALRQLLGAQDRIVSEQCENLERSRREEHQRALDLRASEERFELAVRGSADGLWDWDVVTSAVHFAPRFKQLLGYEEHEMGDDFEAFESRLHPEDHDVTMEAVRAHLERRAPYDVEYRLRTKSGEYRWFRARGQALWDDAGKPLRMAGSITDITRSKHAEAALREATRAAETASRDKSRFLANMSHELRTPLTGILGMTELALGTKLTRVQREYLETIEESSESLLMLVNDLLDFSKIEGGKFALERISFSLRETLTRTIRTLASRAHKKGLELSCRIPPDVPDALVGDPVRLRQIVTNLVGNAIKFTERGEVAVEATVESRFRDRTCLRLTVRDTGIGIADARRAEIFEAFSQGDLSTARRFGGTGLGLAITSQLVQEMGGRIWVDSREEEGSTFRCTLWFGRQRRAPAPAPLPERLRGASVLVVEPREAHARILEELLADWALRPAVAVSGRGALTAAESSSGTPFDYVFLDGEMTAAELRTLVAELEQRRIPPERVVRVLDTANLPERIAEARELGVDVYLVKPVCASNLRDALLRLAGESVPAHVARAADGGGLRREGLRILLAEDSEVVRKLVFGILGRDRHEFVEAHTGREAVEMFRRGRFDVILMDVQMPEMDGLEAARRIREAEAGSGRHVPIVAMTAHALKDDREKCLAAGIDGYVSKPMRAAHLLEEIGRVLGEAESSRGDVPETEDERFAPEAQIVDWNAALARAGGDRTLLHEVMSAFLHEEPGLARRLREAVTGQQADPAGRLLHTLRGALGHLAAGRSLAHVVRMEQALRDGSWDGVREELEPLEAELERLEQAIEAGESGTESPTGP